MEAVSGPERVFHGEMGDSVRIVEPGAVPCAGALNFVDEACSPESGEGKKMPAKSGHIVIQDFGKFNRYVFVFYCLLHIWWRRAESNRRPQVLCHRLYMLIHVY